MLIFGREALTDSKATAVAPIVRQAFVQELFMQVFAWTPVRDAMEILQALPPLASSRRRGQ